MDIVEAKKVSKIYKTLYGKVEALRDVSLNIGSGITGIVGPNGSGKTTLLKIILGIAKPTKGNIRVFGDSPMRREIKRRISYLPEKPVFPKNVTVLELAEYIAKLKDIPMDELVDKLRYMEIYDLDRKVGALSAGMTQKIGIAFSLLSSQELIILDEPTANLDPLWRKKILMEIRKKGNEAAVIFTTHLLHDIERVTDRIVFMNEGRVLLYDLMDNILKKYGSIHYRLLFKNGEVKIIDRINEYLRDEIKNVEIVKRELEDIFEVILNAR